MKRQRGFTLIELLIVIVIIAVVAGLAIPVLVANVEKSRAQEAITNLGSMRDSMIRYFASNNTYVGATVATIDFDPNIAVGGQNRLFAYTIGGLGAATFTLTATRIVGTVNGEALPGGAGPNTITINQSGLVTRNGPYA